MNVFMLRDVLCARLFSAIFGRSFRRFGRKAYIVRPLKVTGMKHISVGNDVVVSCHSWLSADSHGGGDCLLEIGDGARIGNFNHIYASREVRIGPKVLTADKVYISDTHHCYEDIGRAVLDQGVRQLRSVEIGEGSWIGENAVVMGARIGKHCVVGANSVVVDDVPDYSVVVGSPARVIKRYDQQTGRWEKVGGTKS